MTTHAAPHRAAPVRALILGASLALTGAPGLAQVPEVVITEVNFTPQSSGDDQWIELFNRTGSTVDLSTWSLYQATDTPQMVGNYWFAFPPSAVIPAGSFVRVHWLAPIPMMAPPATDIYTGDTIFHFLFGYGAEPLDPDGGALALLRTQNNQLMNDPNVIIDWVSWGGNGYPRENLAVQASKWTQGTTVPAAVMSDSISRSIASVGLLASQNLEFFRDASPTPLMPGAANASTSTTGQSCTNGTRLPGPPDLAARSFPAPGNRDFVMTVANTTGTSNEAVAVVLTNSLLPSPISIFGCPVYIDQTDQIGFLIQPAQAAETAIDSLDFTMVNSGLAGLMFHAQCAVLDMNGPIPASFPHGLSNALSVTIGM